MKLLKVVLIIVVVIVWVYIAELWYNTYYLGDYWQHSSFAKNLLVGLSPLWTAGLGFLAIRFLNKNLN